MSWKQRRVADSLDAQLVRLAGPALAAGALVPLDEMVQAALVGRTSGTAALAAMGVCSSVYLLVFKIFNFLETATTPRVARAGSDHAKVSRCAADALFTAVAIGTAIAVAMQCGSERLLVWLATSPEVARECLPYLRVRALAAPFELMLMAAQGTLRGSQDLSTPAVGNLVSSVLTGGVGFVLMAGYDLGLLGLAIGRLVASIASCALLLATLLRSGRLQWHHLKAAPPIGTYASYARSAGALFVRTLLIKVFFTAVAVEAGQLPTASAAAHVIARQTASLFSIALDSYAAAAQALIATHVGHDQRLARRIGVCAHRAALVLAALMAATLYAGAPHFVRIFTSDPSVHAALGRLMPLFCVLQMLGPPAYVFDGIFLGAADFDYMAQATGLSVAAGFGALHALRQPYFSDWEELSKLWAAWGVHVCARSLCFARRFFASRGPFATPPPPPPSTDAHRVLLTEVDEPGHTPPSPHEHMPPTAPATAEAVLDSPRRRQSPHRSCKLAPLSDAPQRRGAPERRGTLRHRLVHLNRIALVG